MNFQRVQILLLIAAVFLTGCKLREENEVDSGLKGEGSESLPVSECPPYVYRADIDHTVGTPDELTRESAGLPVDVRTKDFYLDPYGFECFGACGRSCNATCSPMPAVTRIYRITYGETDPGRLKKCEYEVKGCRTHPSCRSHDNCYRQKDRLHWADNTAKDTSSGPGIAYGPYRLCDAPLASSRCSAFWMTGNAPLRTGLNCWDFDLMMFARLKTETPITATDGLDSKTETYSRQGRSPVIKINTIDKLQAVSFEQALTACQAKGERLATIQELQAVLTTLKEAVKSGGCIWSGTSSMDSVKRRFSLQLSAGSEAAVTSDPNNDRCHTVCLQR